MTKTELKSIVYIVEDDDIIRETLKAMIESLKQPVKTFSDGNDFIDFVSKQPGNAKLYGCLILDVRMPGLNGMEIQEKLKQTQQKIPIIFITGHGDIPMAVQAMDRGAFGFLEKPFREHELLMKVSAALEKSKAGAVEQKKYAEFETCLNTLTKSERIVFELATDATANKIIADKQGISERTVEVHRSNILKKFNSRSFPEIIKTYTSYKASITS